MKSIRYLKNQAQLQTRLHPVVRFIYHPNGHMLLASYSEVVLEIELISATDKSTD